MEIKNELEQLRERIFNRYRLSSPSRKRDLAYDLTELDMLVDLVNGRNINLNDANCEYTPFIYDYEMGIRQSLLTQIHSNYQFYDFQSHNALTRFADNYFDIKFHRRDIKDPALSQEELLDIAYSFLNSYDEKAYKLFKEMYEDRRILSHDGLDLALGLDGKCFSINALKRSYIMSRFLPSDIVDLSVVIHEFGHSYENKLLFDKNLEQRQGIYATMYCELSAFFFENAFYEYLFKNRINVNETILSKDLFFYLMFEQFLQSYMVLESNEFFCDDTSVDLCEEEFKRVFKQFKENFEFDINLKFSSFNIVSTLTYGNSMLFALKLHEFYQKDPKTFKKDFETLLMSYGLTRDNTPYKVFGIEESEMCELPVLETELKLHNQRKCKYGLK